MNTYDQLWNDPKFLNTRINEQLAYMDQVIARQDIDLERKSELLHAAGYVYEKFKQRLTEVLLCETPNT